MRVLIYEPLPDMNRAPIIAQLAKTLMDDGHEVLVVIEEKLIYTLLGKLTPQGVINCSRTWRRYIGIHRDISVYKLKTPPGQYWLVRSENLRERLKQIAELRRIQYEEILNGFSPEKIFVWNGQHEHLQNFMELARKTHEGKFVYMECGWFPQKGTIYFDTEGVNAASSMAKKGLHVLTDTQRSEVDSWRMRYLKQPLAKYTPGHVFVPLQVETDTNITIHSAFDTMQEFIDHLETWIPAEYSATLRPHPLDTSARRISTKRSNFIIDDSTAIEELIDESEYVVGINSTVLLEALVRGKKVIALGNGYLTKTEPGTPFQSATISTYENSVGLIYLLMQQQVNVAQMAIHEGVMNTNVTGPSATTGVSAAALANANVTVLYKTLLN